jgi:hypothetical protein
MELREAFERADVDGGNSLDEKEVRKDLSRLIMNFLLVYDPLCWCHRARYEC